VSQPTIRKVVRAHGSLARPGHRASFDRLLSSAKDAVWAIDICPVQAAKGHWFQVLLITIKSRPGWIATRVNGSLAFALTAGHPLHSNNSNTMLNNRT
jgi:hypothetical protein